MADLNPEQQRMLENLLEGLDKLSSRARNTSDVLEDGIKARLQDRAKQKLIAKGEAEDAAKVSRAMRQQEENARAASSALDQMGAAVGKLTRSIYAGEAGQKKYAEAVDGVVTALGTLAFFMGGPMMKVLSTVVMGLTKFFKASTDMGDALFKNYQEISRFGAATGDGVQGVYGLMQSFRLSTEQLGQLTQIISENAQGLALFKGTVFGGAQGLADLRKAATATGLELEAFGLGMTPQELNETIAGFVSQQAQLGAMDVRTTDAATKSLRAYIMETDLITKMTGASRKQQEEAMRSAQAIEQFRLKIFQLEQEGTPEALAEAQRLSATFKFLNAQSPGLAKAFAQFTTGVIGPEGVGAMIAGQGAIFEVANARGMDFAEGLARMNRGVQSGLGPGGAIQALAMAGQLGSTLGVNIDELIRFGKISDDVREKLARAGSEQERQRILEEEVTKNMVKTMQADLNSMQAMQDFVQLGVAPATTALAGLAKVAEALTSVLPKSLGQAAAGAAGGFAGFKGGAMLGAKVGTIGGAPGMAVGAAVGGLLGGIGGYFGGKALVGGGGATSVNPEDVIKFGGGMTGTRQHFDKLEPSVKDAFLQMALEYNNLTGDKLQINSAFRTPGEQAAIDPGANPKAAPGMSLHNQGRALDIQTDQKNRLIGAGLLSKYGFKHLGNQDPPHIFMQTGGIATGPRSGYSATLHGTEAVVPLPDGKTIPVAMPNLDRSMEQQVGMLGAQLQALQDIVRYMRENTSISAKILQAANN